MAKKINTPELDTDGIAALAKKHFFAFLLAVSALIGGGATPAEEEEEEAPAPPAKKPAAPAKPATKKAAAKPAPEEEEEAPAITLPALRAKGLQLVQAKRGDELTALCEEYGAKSLSTLDPEHYVEVDGRLDELLSV